MLRNFPSNRNPAGAACPECEARGTLRAHGSYRRWFQDGGEGEMRKVKVRRVRCSACGSTHAVLPERCVPYKTLSVRVMAAICIARKHGEKVADVCARFLISARTLYRILDELPALKAMMCAASGVSLERLASRQGCVGALVSFLAVFSRMPFEKVTKSRSIRVDGHAP